MTAMKVFDTKKWDHDGLSLWLRPFSGTVFDGTKVECFFNGLQHQWGVGLRRSELRDDRGTYEEYVFGHSTYQYLWLFVGGYDLYTQRQAWEAPRSVYKKGMWYDGVPKGRFRWPPKEFVPRLLGVLSGKRGQHVAFLSSSSLPPRWEP